MEAAFMQIIGLADKLASADITRVCGILKRKAEAKLALEDSCAITREVDTRGFAIRADVPACNSLLGNGINEMSLRGYIEADGRSCGSNWAPYIGSPCLTATSNLIADQDGRTYVAVQLYFSPRAIPAIPGKLVGVIARRSNPSMMFFRVRDDREHYVRISKAEFDGTVAVEPRTGTALLPDSAPKPGNRRLSQTQSDEWQRNHFVFLR